jgi:broad specificity phosphatase PhoE
MGCSSAKPAEEKPTKGVAPQPTPDSTAFTDDKKEKAKPKEKPGKPGLLQACRDLGEVPDGIYRQHFAVVRHGHRKDQDKSSKWKESEEARLHPYDSPLTDVGIEAAKKVGESLNASADVAKWKLVISSPYIRCIQTAAEIARIVGVPMVLDVEFGEVFDDVYMPKSNGKLQYRKPQELQEILQKDYPDVEFILAGDGNPRLFGQPPKWPESFPGAQVRFLERFEATSIKMIEKEQNAIIVSHGDAVMILLALLNPRVDLKKIEYCGYFCAWRDTEAPDREKDTWKDDLWAVAEGLSVYQNKWNVEVGDNIRYSEREDSEMLNLEASGMQEHAKEHVSRYRKKVKTDKNMWTMTPAAAQSMKAATKDMSLRSSTASMDGDRRTSRYVEDEENGAENKEEQDFSRRQKAHLTATAALVKNIQKEMQQLPRQHVGEPQAEA